MSKEQAILQSIPYLLKISETAYELSKQIYDQAHLYVENQEHRDNMNLPVFIMVVRKLIRSRGFDKPIDPTSPSIYFVQQSAASEVLQVFMVIQATMIKSYPNSWHETAFDPSTLEGIFNIMRSNNYSQFQSMKTTFALEEPVGITKQEQILLQTLAATTETTARACRQINLAHIIKHFIWTAARKDAAFLAYLVAIPLHCLR